MHISSRYVCGGGLRGFSWPNANNRVHSQNVRQSCDLFSKKTNRNVGCILSFSAFGYFRFGSKSTTELNESESDPHQAESLEVDSRRAIDRRGEEVGGGGGDGGGWAGTGVKGEYSSTISEGATKL
jgi:hypothetical protein